MNTQENPQHQILSLKIDYLSGPGFIHLLSAYERIYGHYLSPTFCLWEHKLFSCILECCDL